MATKPTRRKFTRPADLPGRVCRVLEGLAANEDDEFARMVYRFSHIASGRCQHDNWMAEFERVEREVESMHYTSPNERAARNVEEITLETFRSMENE